MSGSLARPSERGASFTADHIETAEFSLTAAALLIELASRALGQDAFLHLVLGDDLVWRSRGEVGGSHVDPRAAAQRRSTPKPGRRPREFAIPIEEIVRLRDEEGWSQKELAERLGTSESTISRRVAEHAAANPSNVVASVADCETGFEMPVTQDPKAKLR
ncbi:MAG: helix-turn-helix domain-containing protein [Myxococcota bacterium]|nr:helix-turn-helix domain-containing protein [Myxococcota bacterium]